MYTSLLLHVRLPPLRRAISDQCGLRALSRWVRLKEGLRCCISMSHMSDRCISKSKSKRNRHCFCPAINDRFIVAITAIVLRTAAPRSMIVSPSPSLFLHSDQRSLHHHRHCHRSADSGTAINDRFTFTSTVFAQRSMIASSPSSLSSLFGKRHSDQ